MWSMSRWLMMKARIVWICHVRKVWLTTCSSLQSKTTAPSPSGRMMMVASPCPTSRQ